MGCRDLFDSGSEKGLFDIIGCPCSAARNIVQALQGSGTFPWPDEAVARFLTKTERIG